MDLFGVSGPELGIIGLAGLLLLGPRTMASLLARAFEWRERLHALRGELIGALDPAGRGATPEPGAAERVSASEPCEPGTGERRELSAAARSWSPARCGGAEADSGVEEGSPSPGEPRAPSGAPSPVDEGAHPDR